MADLGRVRRREDTGGYFVDLRPYGRVYRIHGIPIIDERTAQRVLEQIRARLAEGEPIDVVIAAYLPRKAKPNQVLEKIGRWLDVKLQECEAGELSPTYVRKLARYADPDGPFSWWEGRSIHDISYAALEDWSLWLARRNLSPKTRWNILGAFRSFVGWLKRRRELRTIPEFPWPKLNEHQPKILSAQAQDAILNEIPDERRGIFLAMALMGIRPGEARALDVAHYGDGRLDVSRAMKGSRLDAPILGTKTGKGKRLPVPERLREWFGRHVDPAGRLTGAPLFANPATEGRWTPSSLRRTWEKACARVGVSGVSIYEGCKHSFATDAIGRGVQERHLQAFLGHADVRSTRRYAKLADAGLLHVLRTEPPTQKVDDLSRTCPAHLAGDKKPIVYGGLLVEAGGIEPPSA